MRDSGISSLVNLPHARQGRPGAGRGASLMTVLYYLPPAGRCS